ncbi:GNAT family N-acetyltransferase [Saccharopolyspora sp. TS4A08]|uniref:GNAT family N-acetyltransferase n=1 Tax=Saccharopolyspora ipomoeae TaxID=3042027 RepID=A0ABT6PK78_9PSEU|nr:GNAT family N-acetyltransferase [Saccharopolyspora sp. TS4A08]MDI2028401.1 GNAT family N-acetyltransferase [Saccharopolyspora sp. TS4A08]
MAEADVRDAVASDAAEIARIQVETWQTAYAEILPPAVLAGLDSAAAEQEWREAVTSGSATVLLAIEGRWTVGFCAAGPAPEPEVAAADGSLPADASTTVLVSALLVEPRWGRRGHAGRLLGTVGRRYAAAGATRGIAWVPESDSASLSFYRAAGWSPDGTVRTLDAGGRPLREMRLTGPLDFEFEHH